jgi:phosphatidate cytidylyltransferase
MAGDLGRRLAVAAVGIPVGILLIWLGGWALGITLAALAAIGTWELYELAGSRPADSVDGAKGATAEPFYGLGISASVLLVLWVTWNPVWTSFAHAGWILTLFLLGGALSAAVFRRGPGGGPLRATSITVAGMLYVAGTLAFALLLRHLPDEAARRAGGVAEPLDGTLLLLFPLVAVWVGDSAAYFAGSRWGRRKLRPSVSPAKTVEGGVAGLVGSVLAGALFGGVLLSDIPGYGLSAFSGAWIGLAIGFTGQLGDLAESLLKREAGVKDSGRLLPGHGGVLDRFDGLLLALPLAYLLIVLHGWLPAG